MFDPTDGPRIFGTAPGIDFTKALVDGLVTRCSDLPPDALSKATLYVNTTRTQRRIKAAFDAGPPRLLPRIRLITDLANDPTLDIPPAASPLRRRLELSQVVAKLLEQQPDLAKSSLYDLSDSLARLMDEMQGEGVAPDVFAQLDVSDQSGHWERALTFLQIIAPFFSASSQTADQQARQRIAISQLSTRWARTPPEHPIIVAGSTGSRGATAQLMEVVAGLPQGAIVLPGFDFDLPQDVWGTMTGDQPCHDHPQYRFAYLQDLLAFKPCDVQPWTSAAPAQPARNRLISLALRPAPVTNQWLEDGPKLGDLRPATENLTLLEAASARAEAETIALRLRQALDEGITAALISPDRMLTRQVTAALDRWGVVPDDSAGKPLALSPPGRLLRHVSNLLAKPLTSEMLLTLLKHPLTHSGRQDRGDHLRHTRDLELHLRRFGPPFPVAETLRNWAGEEEGRRDWAAWVATAFCGKHRTGEDSLAGHIDWHLQTAQQICGGPTSEDAGALWQEAAGRAARAVCDDLITHGDMGGHMSPADYAVLFGAVLAEGTIRDRDAGHPNLIILGTLEARVQSADLTILGGMNEGIWPATPPPDPWLNRRMRMDAGLPVPERQIGLSAHDFQQAVAGREVWITRSKRSAESETVASRWVNRLTNLMSGLPDQNGPDALKAMRDRGDHWAAMAARLSAPVGRVPPAPRPSPCPPPAARPTEISVTQIKTLIRDPFSIYAQKVLRLSDLDPLSPTADAPLRGIIIHKILERFLQEEHSAADRDALMRIAEEEFAKNCPWPTIRAMWFARMDRVADQFLQDEADRRHHAVAHHIEVYGQSKVQDLNISVICKADRIDVDAGGNAWIYDYKTGSVPTVSQQMIFDKQLLVEAAMAERGAFKAIGARPVAEARFIAVNSAMKNVAAPLRDSPPDQVWGALETLLTRWSHVDRGYTARLALFSKTDVTPFDHLSRYGEWDTSDDVTPAYLT